MALFQNAVIKKYLQAQNKEQLKEKWLQFQQHFHNPTIQENICNSKEEQYQGEFLIDLFVNVLGYTKNPQPNFNLTTEYKNVKDSKKADGAILIDQKVRAVIELKGTNTTDLSKIETQAFGYKNNQPDCIYIITSNFEKIRFYIDNAIEYLEFNLFQLQPNEFELLYLCLAHENLSKGIAKSIKEESVSQEDVITKKLYKDYSLFKRELYHNLVALNPEYEPLELFQKSQKLLDRFLFIFFAEDRNLLPTNLIFRINKEWQNLRLMRIEVSLYERYKVYFNDLNSGAKVVLPAFSETASKQIEEHQIFAYNGGLFKADEILDTIKIDDSVLFKHTENLSNYDFASEVDVNILGHIFENSLNELDEIKAELEGEVIDKTKTKRKKDGVFYTPKYITKYIVENTIGKLCDEKKNELQLNEEDYITDKKRQKKTLQGLIDKLQLYRNWLLQLTICDPACGSGAFLNQALDFLIEEHKYIDELQAKLFGDTFILSDVENSILENNLFGVDLNEESVEIAKLSLWLRTAQPNRKLNDLNGNIKCGNSLIDDPEIAGEKAFNWQQAFPKVFAKGGFDVIIGNPPYVFGGNNSINEFEKKYFKENYITGNGKVNLFTLFIEKSNNVLKINGEFSFIIPNTFLRVTSYHDSREFFIKNFQFRELADLGNDVFNGAVTSAIILIAKKCSPDLNKSLRIINDFSGNFKLLTLEQIIKSNFMISSTIELGAQNILDKLSKKSILLGDECDEMIFGVVISHNKDELVFDEQIGNLKPFLEGKDISSYLIKGVSKFLKYEPKLIHRARTPKVFEVEEKLLVQRITGGRKPIKVAYDNFKYYNKESINNIIIKSESSFKSKFILVLLNSTLINWFYNKSFTNDSTLTVNISKEYLSKIPIKKTSLQDQQPLIKCADLMIQLNKTLQMQQFKVVNMLQRDFGLEKPSKKLESWYELSLQEFFKELSKSKIELSSIQKDEVQEYFETHQKQAIATKNEIVATDKAIDKMVYELYGLSEEEISVVENS